MINGKLWLTLKFLHATYDNADADDSVITIAQFLQEPVGPNACLFEGHRQGQGHHLKALAICDNC